MAERAKSSRRFTKEGSIVSVSSSLFPEENCDMEKVYGVLDRILPNGLYRIKWKDGFTSLIEEEQVQFEKEISDINIPDNDRTDVVLPVIERTVIMTVGKEDSGDVLRNNLLDDAEESAEQGSAKEGEVLDVASGKDVDKVVSGSSKDGEDE